MPGPFDPFTVPTVPRDRELHALIDLGRRRWLDPANLAASPMAAIVARQRQAAMRQWLLAALARGRLAASTRPVRTDISPPQAAVDGRWVRFAERVLGALSPVHRTYLTRKVDNLLARTASPRVVEAALGPHARLDPARIASQVPIEHPSGGSLSNAQGWPVRTGSGVWAPASLDLYISQVTCRRHTEWNGEEPYFPTAVVYVREAALRRILGDIDRGAAPKIAIADFEHLTRVVLPDPPVLRDGESARPRDGFLARAPVVRGWSSWAVAISAWENDVAEAAMVVDALEGARQAANAIDEVASFGGIIAGVTTAAGATAATVASCAALAAFVLGIAVSIAQTCADSDDYLGSTRFAEERVEVTTEPRAPRTREYEKVFAGDSGAFAVKIAIGEGPMVELRAPPPELPAGEATVVPPSEPHSIPEKRGHPDWIVGDKRDEELELRVRGLWRHATIEVQPESPEYAAQVSWDGVYQLTQFPAGTVLHHPGKPDATVEQAFTRIRITVHWWYNGIPFGNGMVAFRWTVLVTDPT